MFHRLAFEPFLLTSLPVSNQVENSAKQEITGLAQRDCTLQFIVGFDKSLYRRWPWKQWDEVESIFFGPEDLDLGWASVKMACLTPRGFEKVTQFRSFDMMINIFGWAQRSTKMPRVTIMSIDETPAHRHLDELNEKAVAEDWNSYRVANRLVSNKIPEKSTVVVSSKEDITLLLTCELVEAIDENVCPIHFGA
ncbi:hypothetical protein F5Y16DRAFT_404234 [Xylariaceae sp. FL0255]|nr:hypothetical protein F5Y16DRAFT_404234 [Xylariaceae sp. FL0255]